MSVKDCLSDEGTLSFRQGRWFAICEPLEFSASVRLWEDIIRRKRDGEKREEMNLQ